MTNHQVLQRAPLGQAQAGATGSLKSLAQALDKLVDDQRSFLYLTLPEQTVAEIQEHFTIKRAASGTTGDAGR